jgi:hypothetical protein
MTCTPRTLAALITAVAVGTAVAPPALAADTTVSAEILPEP